ncbi:MAG: response regulator [Bacteroidota bacterium]
MNNLTTDLSVHLQKTLIIDDEIDICMLLKSFLKKRNKDVSYSTSLKDGYEKLVSQQPEILILDQNLPDGLGINNIRKFKESIKGKPLFVVVISAMSNLQKQAMDNGADFFIPKPISYSSLNQALELMQPL